MRSKSTRQLFLALSFLLMSSTSQAHEFMVVPQIWENYSINQTIPFQAISSHIFMKGEELEDPSKIEIQYEGKKIEFAADKAFQAYTGSITLKKNGTALIHGHRLGEVWSKTVNGILKGDKNNLDNVIWSKKYEKFCKTLLPVGGKTEGWDQKIGDALEIVPLNNPLQLKVGDTLKIQILYRGKPVSPQSVKATYAGFTDIENSYAYTTEPYGAGKAKIKISNSGLWMVRTQYIANEKGKNYGQHVMRAILLFPVK